MLFRNRLEAGRQLAQRLQSYQLHHPLVLAIPRGGVVVGAALAHDLRAELDVVLSRKLRAPGQPELALGAVAEDGRMFLNPEAEAFAASMEDYLAAERQHQMAEITRRQRLVRKVRQAATIAGRTIIVTDDGIATGATMLAALHVLRGQDADRVIVAVPVASHDRLMQVRHWCDEVVCLMCPEDFWSIGQFYEDFEQIDDEQVVALLREQGAYSIPLAGSGSRY